MKQLLWIIILFALAIGVAVATRTYTGNVYLVIEHTMIRVNLHLFVLGLVASVVALYILVRLIAGILSTPDKLSRFGVGRRNRKATQSLNAAGLAYFEGKFQEAQAQADKVLANKEAGDKRILALMLAAHAADQSGNAEARDQYLHDIEKLPEKTQLSRHLLLAESAINQQNDEEAENHLKAAAQINPRLTRLVRLQLRHALDKGNALEILDKVDKLRRAGAMNDNEAEQLSERAYAQLLSLAQDAADLLSVFVQSAQYLDEYGQQKAIDTADTWLRQNPNDPKLLAALGDLAYHRQLWGKAQGYLEASLRLEPTVHARLTLAKVFEQSQRHNDAQEQRRLALSAMDETAEH